MPSRVWMFCKSCRFVPFLRPFWFTAGTELGPERYRAGAPFWGRDLPEFEVRLFKASGDLLEAVITDAASEKAALTKAAKLAKKKGASFFDVRRPMAQRWVRKGSWS